MLIKNYKINNFTAGTLKRFNLCTRITLNNNTGEDCVILANIKNFMGECIDKTEELLNFGVLKNNFSKHITDEDLKDINSKEDVIYEFALLPQSLFIDNKERDAEIDLKTLSSYIGAQDHYVEYFNNAMSFGVLYQVPPSN